MKLPDGWIVRVKPKGITQIEIVQDELVLCKNCKHYVVHSLFGKEQGWCERLCDEFDARTVEPDDFCSRGEGE